MSFYLVSGAPATCEWLSGVLQNHLGSTCSVTGFNGVEHSRVIGAHSVTERVSVEFSTASAELPSHIYWKQIVVKNLPVKAGYKLLRDVTSYRVETRFYQHFSPQLSQRGILTPKCYFAEEHFDEKELTNSQFLILLEDLRETSFTQQRIFFDESHTLAAIGYLASLHATFWGGNKASLPDLSLLWKEGTYWTLDKRPADELESLPAVWAEFCGNFLSTSDIFRREEIAKLGKRLVAKTPWITAARSQSSTPLTLVHGDFKSANIFFREDSSQAIQDVSVIDWQWSGSGFGISDVMYVILGAHNLGLHENNFALERKLIKHYCEQLANRGVEYKLETAIRDFRLAALDFARVILAYFFRSYTPHSLTTAMKDPGELTHTSSLPHVIDLLLYLSLLLEQLETHGDFTITAAS